MIENIGFNAWFKDRIDHGKTDKFQIARIISVNKDSYLIRNEKSEVFAQLTGRLLFQAESPLDYPTVGDWVYVQYFNDDTFAIIDDIFPRKTVLKRKTSGKKIEFQLIAANIDFAMIIQSLDINFNIRRLERYLAMINEAEIKPIVLLSKSDLIPSTEVNDKISEVSNLMPDLKLTAFSNLPKAGIDKVRDILNVGMTYCFVGSSGVGKTTLLNNLIGAEIYNTKTISDKTNKGQHATTSRQLHILRNGAMIVDTPGMRELGNIAVESGLDKTFDEIAELTDQCRFKNCTHINEDGCAVLIGLAKGTILKERYDNYLKMHKESAYYKMSYLEKRQKDKKFGKMIKSVMKHKKKK